MQTTQGVAVDMPPAEAPEPNRADCAAIRATGSYLSDTERSWFQANCINSGVAAAECPGILDVVAEPDMVALDLATGTITNERTGVTAAGSALPDELIAIVADGGLLVRLQRGGYVRVGHG